ncbi:transposase, partial [Pseudomonas syringae pv. actinidiae ICMP 19079]
MPRRSILSASERDTLLALPYTQGLTDAGKPVNTNLYQYLSPLGWEHINLTGDYVW